MSLCCKFTAEPHSRCSAKTDPIEDLLYIMIAFNLDAWKEAVGIMAADEKSFWQSVNTVKANGGAQRSCNPDKHGSDFRFAQ
jgi:hypothetical protein